MADYTPLLTLGIGLLLGSIIVLIFKSTTARNWFFLLDFSVPGRPAIIPKKIRPGQSWVRSTTRDGVRLAFKLLEGYAHPYGKDGRGTVYFGHMQAGGPLALRDARDASKDKALEGKLMEWDWKIQPITPSASEMAGVQDDERELKWIRAQRAQKGFGIPIMWLLIGGGVLLFIIMQMR